VAEVHRKKRQLQAVDVSTAKYLGFKVLKDTGKGSYSIIS
jgi:hypothetical protein